MYRHQGRKQSWDELGDWETEMDKYTLCCAKSLQSCPTLCDPMDCSPPGSAVHWGFSRQEHWSGLTCPPPGHLPNSGKLTPKLTPLVSPALADRFFSGSTTWEVPTYPLEVDTSVAQLCLTLCDPVDSSLPGSSVYGVFPARILEWVAISFSRGSSQLRDGTWVSCIAGRCFMVWAAREAPMYTLLCIKKCIK